MIPVLVDGVKKYLLTEEEVDAKISESSGGSSSENPGGSELNDGNGGYSPFLFTGDVSKLSTDLKYRLMYALYVNFSRGRVSLYQASTKQSGDGVMWGEVFRWSGEQP